MTLPEELLEKYVPHNYVLGHHPNQFTGPGNKPAPILGPRQRVVSDKYLEAMAKKAMLDIYTDNRGLRYHASPYGGRVYIDRVVTDAPEFGKDFPLSLREKLDLVEKAKTPNEVAETVMKQMPFRTWIYLEGADLETAKEIGYTISKLAHKNPEHTATLGFAGIMPGETSGFQQQVTDVTTYQLLDARKGLYDSSTAWATVSYGNVRDTGNVIQILTMNPRSWTKGSIEETLDKIADDAEPIIDYTSPHVPEDLPWHPNDTGDITGILEHEFGHVIANNFRGALIDQSVFNNEETSNETKERLQLETKNDHDRWSTMASNLRDSWPVSRYAQKNEFESYSEAYSAGMVGIGHPSAVKAVEFAKSELPFSLKRRLDVQDFQNKVLHPSLIIQEYGKSITQYAVYWRLGPGHEKEDICDKLARGGPKKDGFYPRGIDFGEEGWARPHPNCNCLIVPYSEVGEEGERLVASKLLEYAAHSYIVGHHPNQYVKGREQGSYNIGITTPEIAQEPFGIPLGDKLPELDKSLKTLNAKDVTASIAIGGWKNEEGKLFEENALSLGFNDGPAPRVVEEMSRLGRLWQQEAVLVQQLDPKGDLQAVIDFGRKLDPEEIRDVEEAVKEHFGGWTFAQETKQPHTNLVVSNVRQWGGPENEEFAKQVAAVAEQLNEAGEKTKVGYRHVINYVLDTSNNANQQTEPSNQASSNEAQGQELSTERTREASLSEGTYIQGHVSQTLLEYTARNYQQGRHPNQYIKGRGPQPKPPPTTAVSTEVPAKKPRRPRKSYAPGEGPRKRGDPPYVRKPITKVPSQAIHPPEALTGKMPVFTDKDLKESLDQIDKAKDTRVLQQVIRDNWVYYSGEDIVAYLPSLDLTQAKEVTKASLGFLQEFPRTAKSLKYIGELPSYDAFADKTGPFGDPIFKNNVSARELLGVSCAGVTPNTYAITGNLPYSPHISTTVINQHDLFEKGGKIDEAYADDIAAGFHVESGHTPAYSVTTHELGHVIEAQIRDSHDSNVKDAYFKWRGWIGLHEMPISQYAKDSDQERFAETFVDEQLSLDHPHSADTAVMHELIEAYKKANEPRSFTSASKSRLTISKSQSQSLSEIEPISSKVTSDYLQNLLGKRGFKSVGATEFADKPYGKGFVTPDGSIYDIRSFDHPDIAESVVNDLGVTGDDKGNALFRYDDLLLSHSGFARITDNSSGLYVQTYGDNIPTQQIATMAKLAKDKPIIWDHHGSKGDTHATANSIGEFRRKAIEAGAIKESLLTKQILEIYTARHYIPGHHPNQWTGLARKMIQSGRGEGKLLGLLFSKSGDAAYNIGESYDISTVTDKMRAQAAKQVYEFTQHALETKGVPDTVTVYRIGDLKDEIVSATLNRATSEAYKRLTGHGEPLTKDEIVGYQIPRSAILVDVNAIMRGRSKFPLEEEILVRSEDLKKAGSTSTTKLPLTDKAEAYMKEHLTKVDTYKEPKFGRPVMGYPAMNSLWVMPSGDTYKCYNHRDCAKYINQGIFPPEAEEKLSHYWPEVHLMDNTGAIRVNQTRSEINIELRSPVTSGQMAALGRIINKGDDPKVVWEIQRADPDNLGKRRESDTIASGRSWLDFRRAVTENNYKLQEARKYVAQTYVLGHHPNQYIKGLGKSPDQRAFRGESIPQAPENVLNTDQKGALGEAITMAWLHENGFPDARYANIKLPNFPIDIIAKGLAVEVKAGTVNNTKKAQWWRVTLGQPGPKETAWLKTISAEEKLAWNKQKKKDAIARKWEEVRNFSKEQGKPIKAKTIALIIDNDRKVADMYMFDGFHETLYWKNSAKEGTYLGSFSYSTTPHHAAKAA